jgi:hypothetical protein
MMVALHGFSCGRSASPPNSGSESLGTVLLILGVLVLNMDRGAVNACAALDFNQLPAAVVAVGGGKVVGNRGGLSDAVGQRLSTGFT